VTDPTGGVCANAADVISAAISGTLKIKSFKVFLPPLGGSISVPELRTTSPNTADFFRAAFVTSS
jgi:hypothetical protein